MLHTHRGRGNEVIDRAPDGASGLQPGALPFLPSDPGPTLSAMTSFALRSSRVLQPRRADLTS